MTARMKHNGDLFFGALGTSLSFGLGSLNLALGCTAGALTVFVMLLRARREWRHRNDPPDEL